MKLSVMLKNVIGRYPMSFKKIKIDTLETWMNSARDLEEKLAEYENLPRPALDEGAWTVWARNQMEKYDNRDEWGADFGYSLLIALEDVEVRLAEYENDETARRRADTYKIRTLELIAIDAMEYFEADYSRPAFYYKAVKYMDGN